MSTQLPSPTAATPPSLQGLTPVTAEPERRSTQEQLDDLSARLIESHAQIAVLREDALEASQRADASDGRAYAVRRRVDNVESRADVDREMLRALQVEGMLQQENAKNFEAALSTSRTIGAAVGICMAFHKVSEPGAFAILRKASMDGNRKLSVLAEEVVLTGSAAGLPSTLVDESRCSPHSWVTVGIRDGLDGPTRLTHECTVCHAATDNNPSIDVPPATTTAPSVWR